LLVMLPVGCAAPGMPPAPACVRVRRTYSLTGVQMGHCTFCGQQQYAAAHAQHRQVDTCQLYGRLRQHYNHPVNSMPASSLVANRYTLSQPYCTRGNPNTLAYPLCPGCQALHTAAPGTSGDASASPCYWCSAGMCT
jgi:hypothetical protein